MKRALITTAVLILALAVGAPALAEESSRIVDIRVGRHAAFDRLVLELERRVELRRLPGSEPGALWFEIDARPLLPYQTLHTPYRRMGSVAVRGIPTGAQIKVESRPRRVRIFRLSGPHRIVLDFADPGVEPFLAPPGTEAVLAPAPEPEPPVREAPAPMPPSEAGAEPNRPASALEAGAAEEAEPVEPAPEKGVVSRVPEPDESEEPAVAPVPAAESPAALEVRSTVEAAPAPAPPPARFQLPRAALWTGGIVLAVGVALSALLWHRVGRRQRQRAGPADAAPEDWPRAPETITPEEIVGASDHVDLLGRRIDEEVRARMHLEERLSHVQQELKVMRDRLQRAKRSGG